MVSSRSSVSFRAIWAIRCSLMAKRSKNAIIDLKLSAIISAIETGSAVGPDAILRNEGQEIIQVDLGALQYEAEVTEGGQKIRQLRSVRLTFSDLSPLPDGRMVFLATAEDTDTNTGDGKIVGSAVGILDRAGNVTNYHQFSGRPIKPEGLHATLKQNGDVELLIVDDPDDPQLAGKLRTATLPAAKP